MRKLTFFRALKNIIGCALCPVKGCGLRYYSGRGNVPSFAMRGQKCKKEKTLDQMIDEICNEKD